MAKSLSAFTTTKTDNPYVDIVRVVKIEFAGITLNLCDRVWGDPGEECEFNGTLYEPLIESWGTIRSGRINPVTYKVEPGGAEFSVLNGIPVGGADSFAALFLLYYPHFVIVTISEFHVGALAAEDSEDIFKGSIEDLPPMTTDIVPVTCASFELSIQNKFAHDIVDATTYPGADPDDLGKMLPQAYGRPKRVPFMAVDAGWITTLAQDLGAAATGFIYFTDVSGMPSSGTVQIDGEQMTYAAKSDVNNTLNINARGQNGTDDVDHDFGATVAEILSDYFYIIGHAIKAFDAIYVEDAQGNQVLQPPENYTAYTGQSEDEHASYPGKACIKFTVLPILVKQINVILNDDLTVSDNISFAIGGSTKKLYPTGATGSFSPLGNLYDGSEVTCGNGYAAVLTFPSTNYGSIINQYVWILVKSGAFLLHWQASGWSPADITVDAGITTWIRFQKAGGSWADSFSVMCSTQGDLCECYKEVNYTPTATKSGAAYRAGANTLTGNSVADTVIGGRVSADLQAYQDDGEGTYTGVAYALIERPDHILKHVLGHRCGLTLADVIDAITYNAAGVYYAAYSFALAVVLLEKPNPRILINQIAFQSKSLEHWEAGVHHIKYLPRME